MKDVFGGTFREEVALWMISAAKAFLRLAECVTGQ